MGAVSTAARSLAADVESVLIDEFVPSESERIYRERIEASESDIVLTTRWVVDWLARGLRVPDSAVMLPDLILFANYDPRDFSGRSVPQEFHEMDRVYRYDVGDDWGAHVYPANVAFMNALGLLRTAYGYPANAIFYPPVGSYPSLHRQMSSVISVFLNYRRRLGGHNRARV